MWWPIIEGAGSTARSRAELFNTILKGFVPALSMLCLEQRCLWSGGLARPAQGSRAQCSWEIPHYREECWGGASFVVSALFQFSHFYSVLESDPQFGFEEAKRKLQGMDTKCSVVLCLALQKLAAGWGSSWLSHSHVAQGMREPC